jgi:hypothetical protein
VLSATPRTLLVSTRSVYLACCLRASKTRTLKEKEAAERKKADEAARKKAEDDAAAVKKKEEEAAAKKKAEDEAAKKKADEAAAKEKADEAASKKAEDEAARKKDEEAISPLALAIVHVLSYSNTPRITLSATFPSHFWLSCS